MKISRQALKDATEKGLITEPQAEQLWRFLLEDDKDVPAFRFTHILYYLGGLIAIGAMSLFMTLGWERFGSWGLLLISLAYAGIGIFLTELLLKRNLRIPAGIAATFVVALAPLAIYALQAALGWWPEGFSYRDYHGLVEWRWLWMEFGTLAVGAVLLWRYRLPFLVMPVAVTFWYVSMDLTAMAHGGADPDWNARKMMSLWIGLFIVGLAFRADMRSRGRLDYAFWLYLFGVLTFWGALSAMDSDSELGKFLYFCVNLLLIGAGAVLSRRVFAVFGGVGVAGYFGRLAYEVFEGSLLFPFVLTLIGAGIVYLGILWQRNEDAISAKLRGLLPVRLRELIDRRD